MRLRVFVGGPEGNGLGGWLENGSREGRGREKGKGGEENFSVCCGYCSTQKAPPPRNSDCPFLLGVAGG